jgi:unsaturated rhamnogalacturonyl hydrolase
MTPDRPEITADRVAAHLQTLDLDGKSWVTGVAINGLLAEGSEQSVRVAEDHPSLAKRRTAVQQ